MAIPFQKHKQRRCSIPASPKHDSRTSNNSPLVFDDKRPYETSSLMFELPKGLWVCKTILHWWHFSKKLNRNV